MIWRINFRDSRSIKIALTTGTCTCTHRTHMYLSACLYKSAGPRIFMHMYEYIRYSHIEHAKRKCDDKDSKARFISVHVHTRTLSCTVRVLSSDAEDVCVHGWASEFQTRQAGRTRTICWSSQCQRFPCESDQSENVKMRRGCRPARAPMRCVTRWTALPCIMYHVHCTYL